MGGVAIFIVLAIMLVALAPFWVTLGLILLAIIVSGE